MQKINFQNLPSTTTPLNATNMNAIQTNVENVFNGTEPAGNMVVDSIRSKNMWQNVLNNIVKSGTSSLTLNNDIYTFVASGVDMYFGQIANTGNTYDDTRGILYKVKPNTTYSLSLSNSSFNKNLITSYNSSKVSLGYSSYSSNVITFTTANNCEYITIRIGINPATTGTTYTTTVQLEEGSTATTYSPYQELDRPTIQTGSGTINTTYIDTVENNHYEKSENVVSYSFTMKVKGTWGVTTQFISGLPKAKQFTRFLAINTSNNSVCRFEVYTDGTIHNAYSSTTPSAAQSVEGHVVYMTED